MLDDFMKNHLDYLEEIRDLLKVLAGKGNDISKSNMDHPEDPMDYLDEFALLKELLESSEWPMAVDPDLISDESSDSELAGRAEGIMDFMVQQPIQGKKFLDFGCGTGHFVAEAKKRGCWITVGYDTQVSPWWENLAKDKETILTDNWETVKKHAPYDCIILCDVIDHIDGDPIELLKKVKSVCNSETKVLTRCHPWTSRSATHLYRRMNKAFVHLVFSDIELTRLGLGGGYPCKVTIHPQLTYMKWIGEAGFEILDVSPVTEPVESFFEKSPIVAERIKKHWSGSHDPLLASGQNFPTFQLKLQFIDHTLRIKSGK